MKLWPTILAYDVHFDSIQDFNLTSLSLRYSNLNPWAATTGFTVNFSPSLYPVEVRYAQPEPIQVELADGVNLTFTFAVSGPSIPALSELHIVQRAWVNVTSSQGRRYEDLLRRGRTRIHSAEKLRKHRERLDRLLNVVNESDRKWLERSLRHSHEPSAAERIRRLVKDVDAEWLLDTDAIELAANLRNFHTHFSPDVESRLPPKDERPRSMHNLTVRLQVLCEMILMKLLGLSNDWMRQQIERTRRLERRLAR